MTIYFYGIVAFFLFLWVLPILAGSSRIHFGLLRQSLPFYLLFGVFLASSLWSIDPGRTLFQSVGLIPFVWLVYMVGLTTRHRPDEWAVGLAIVLTLVIAVLFAYTYQVYGSVRIMSQDMREDIGQFANVGAATLVLCIPLLIYGLRNLSLTGQFISMASLALALFALTISGSRAGVMFAAAILAFLLLRLPGGRKLLVRLTIAALVSLVVVPQIAALLDIDVVAIQERLVERIQESQFVTGEIDASSGAQDYQRVLMHSDAAILFFEHFPLGIGFEGFLRHMQDTHGLQLVSHSILITSAAECGLPGLLLFLWLMWLTLTRVYRCVRCYAGIDPRSHQFYFALGVSVAVAWAQSLVRPNFDNAAFYAVLGLGLAAQLHAFSDSTRQS